MDFEKWQAKKRRRIGVSAALLVAATLLAHGAIVRNAFVTAESAAAMKTDGDRAIVLESPRDRTQVRLTPRPGWKFGGDRKAVTITHRLGGREQVALSALDGEEEATVEIVDELKHNHSTTNCEEHVLTPSMKGEGGGHVLAVYAAPGKGLSELPTTIAGLSFENGQHRVRRLPVDCPVQGCTEQAMPSEELVDVAITPDTLKLDMSTTPGASAGGCYPYGSYHEQVVATWVNAACPQQLCHASARLEGLVDVYELRLSVPHYIGLDWTDAGKTNRIVSSGTYSLLSGFDGYIATLWSVGPKVEAIGRDDEASLSFATKLPPEPSNRYLDECLKCNVVLTDEHEECCARTTASTNFTVVAVNVEIACPGVTAEANEQIEEKPGVEVHVWGPNQPETKVNITCHPGDLPAEEHVQIVAPTNILYEKRNGEYQLASSEYTLAELREREFYLRAGTMTDTNSLASIEVCHVESGARDLAKFRVCGQPLLIPDYDRNARIDPEDYARSQDGKSIFRFWINNDNDSSGSLFSYTSDVNDDNSNVPGSGNNGTNDEVDGRLDLGDFAPIMLDVSRVLGSKATEDDWAAIEWILYSPCLNAVWTPLAEESLEKIYDAEAELRNCGQKLSDPLSTAKVVDLTKGAVIPASLLRKRGQFRRTVFLVEGRAAGRGLTVKGLINGKEICSQELNIVVDDARKMYRWLDLRYVAKGKGEVEQARMSDPVNNPDSDCNGLDREGQHFVFVHGFNVDEKSAEGWAAEMFKRLWQAGSNAKFTAVDWFGNQSQLPGIKETVNYYVNVMNAFTTAPVLADKIKTDSNFKGDRITMLAHSLGNMLVSQAACEFELPYERYYLLNAAVPSEAYDETRLDLEMVDEAWRAIKQELWAAKWADQFEPNDSRHKLKWRGLFKGIPNAYNVYSKTEDVLENRRWDKNKEQCTGGSWWTNQELWKGTSGIKVINLVSWPEMVREGGWGFNGDYYRDWFNRTIFGEWRLDESKLPQINGMDPREARTNPLFIPLKATPDHIQPHAKGTQILERQDELEMKAKYLADGIPAISLAAGANEIKGVAENWSYMNYMDGQWPRTDGRWYHSDIKNIAYCYVKRFFRALVKGAE